MKRDNSTRLFRCDLLGKMVTTIGDRFRKETVGFLGLFLACIVLGWQIWQWRLDQKKEAPNLHCECEESFYSVIEPIDKDNLNMIAVFGISITNQSSSPDWIKDSGNEIRNNPGSYTRMNVKNKIVEQYFHNYDISGYFKVKQKTIGQNEYYYNNIISKSTWYSIFPVKLEPYEIKKAYILLYIDQTANEISKPFEFGFINTRGKKFTVTCETPTKVERRIEQTK